MKTNLKAVSWGALLILLSACDGAKERYENASSTSEGNCVNVFHFWLTDSLEPVNKIHHDLKSFIKSKPSADPLVIHQYTATDEQGHDQSLSCKFKSPDVMSQLTQRSVAPASCLSMNREIVSRAKQRLAGEGKKPTRELQFVDDEEVSLGPFYLRPWPYQVAYEQSGNTYVRAKSLMVSADSWMPVPDSFKGTFYCHLLSPGYAYDLLLGVTSAPPLG
ncbi:hypothetical protein G8770_17005 [Aestuariicella hydrocarbonica]|uniref:Lipoprotein n=1 Tax=Pseudomaricurvus hydrocarbonicus TaxID=1470433 RepID=A0A9E5MN24_9GAMM|nr:hypothetical protein [Aestuariicella hydrocarbonica]NHO67250.1 hypothetical protein [Aestuariicella hydrocarbonica]